VTSNTAQTNAALWIQRNIPRTALTATNAHCLSGTGVTCFSRRWWLSGLGGRRVLIGSWGYTPRGGVAGYWDPALYELNQSVFTDPSTTNIAAIKSLGVQWLVAERTPSTPFSTRLDLLATRVYSNATISIYRLDK
jgi:hypothetical protein